MRNILEFENAFPDVTIVVLEQNYRSTQTILDAANAVIGNNLSRKPKELWTDRGDGNPIVRYHGDDEVDEAQWVTCEIAKLHDGGDMRWDDIAVFYRTNAQSRVVEENLTRMGVPYKVIGGTRLRPARRSRTPSPTSRRSSTRRTRCRSSASSTRRSGASATPASGSSTPTPPGAGSCSPTPCAAPTTPASPAPP